MTVEETPEERPLHRETYIHLSYAVSSSTKVNRDNSSD